MKQANAEYQQKSLHTNLTFLLWDEVKILKLRANSKSFLLLWYILVKYLIETNAAAY